MMMQTTTYRSIHMKDKEKTPQRNALASRLVTGYLPKAVAGLLLIVLLMSGVLLVHSYGNLGVQEQQAGEQLVVVSSGDTLWSIAKAHKPAGMDVREAIHHLQTRNGIPTSALTTGQSLIIPF